jgi:hypothetical protein
MDPDDGTPGKKPPAPSARRRSSRVIRVMTKADFGDFTYVSAALVFRVIMLVFLILVIRWWVNKQ